MIVTVDEVKTHLRIEHDEEDGYIESLIKQSQTAAEDYCRVSFEPEPDEEKPLLSREQTRKLAKTTVQSALTHRTALEMAWR